jgi:RNA polymerase sigma factor (sigma-70 family)
MTKAQLRAYKALRKERDTLARLISELEATIYGPKAVNYDGMPRGGSGPSDPVGALAGKHLSLCEQYEATVAQLSKQMEEIEQAIEVLAPLERVLIRLHYFQGFTWEQIAVELNYTRRHITRMHGRVLEKLQQGETTKCD